MKLKLLFCLLTMGLSFSSCSRDFDNPFDPGATSTPKAPFELSYTILNENSIEIKWKAEQVTGFTIARKDSGQAVFSPLGQLPSNVFRFVDSTASLGHTYIYRITSQNSSTSRDSEVKIRHYFFRPSNLSIVGVSENLISVSWSDNSVFETGFIVEKKQTDDIRFAEIARVGSNTTQYNDPTIEFGKTYYYRIKAFSQSYESQYSDSIRFEHLFLAPSNIRVVSVSPSQLKLLWDAQTMWSDGFRVFRKEGSGAMVVHKVVASSTHEITESNLNASITYSYQIEAFTNRGNSALSNLVKTSYGFEWRKVDFSNESINERTLTAITFPTEMTGYVLGYKPHEYPSSILLKTTDGGASWRAIFGNGSYLPTGSFSEMFFIDENTGWLALRGYNPFGRGSASTSDGGVTWRYYDRTIDALYGIHFIDDKSGWIAGADMDEYQQPTKGYLLATRNGGSSWSSKSFQTPVLQDVYFKDNLTGWAVGWGSILMTTNGGTTWTNLTSDQSLNARQIKFFNSQVGWIVGPFGAMLSTDGGFTWTELLLPDNPSVLSIALLSESFAIALVIVDYTEQMIMITRDQGQSWDKQIINTERDILEIYFRSPNIGWACGEGGTLLKANAGWVIAE